MRRVTVLVPLALALLALVAPEALGQAGGGSSGFSGGGGGGGGGGGSSGGGDGEFSWPGLLVFILIGAFVFGLPALRTYRRRRARAARDTRVTTASVEAAQEDPAFAADAVKPAAAALYAELQRAWSERDDAALERALGADLLVEWRRRLADFARRGWLNEVAIVKGPVVEYVGLVNRAGAEEDRVTVAISATLRSVVHTAAGEIIHRDGDADRDGDIEISEYWTLARSSDGSGWLLVSIEQEEEGAHHLDAPIVTAPWSDDRLADESLVELAAADAPAAGTIIAELVSVEFEGTARAKALDLALADPRCAPDVLEVAARRAVEAWAQAVDGDDAALLELATPQAAQQLLYAGGTAASRSRVVVRGPHLLRLAITALETDAAAPRMQVEAHLSGRRYFEDRDTAAVLSGDKDRATSFTERWTFALDGSAAVPWRLVGAGGLPSG